MIDTKEYSEATVEIIDIIQHLDEDIIEKIPTEIIKKLNEKKSTTYESSIDFTKPLEENNLKPTTRAMLALIYRNYICTTEKQKELDKMFEENQEKKYNKNIFKSSDTELRLVPVKAKKNIFQRIIEKLFKRKSIKM